MYLKINFYGTMVHPPIPPQPQIRHIQLGKSILSAQADVKNFFNQAYHLQNRFEDYNSDFFFNLNPIRFHLFGIASYKTFISFALFLISKFWCGIHPNLEFFTQSSGLYPSITISILNYPDVSQVEKSNLLSIQWQIKITRYPPRLLNYILIFSTSRRIYHGLKYLTSIKTLDYKTFQEQLRKRTSIDKLYNIEQQKTYHINGFSYFSFDNGGRISSHSVENIIPPPRYGVQPAISLLFKYFSVGSRLAYFLRIK